MPQWSRSPLVGFLGGHALGNLKPVLGHPPQTRAYLHRRSIGIPEFRTSQHTLTARIGVRSPVSGTALVTDTFFPHGLLRRFPDFVSGFVFSPVFCSVFSRRRKNLFRFSSRFLGDRHAFSQVLFFLPCFCSVFSCRGKTFQVSSGFLGDLNFFRLSGGHANNKPEQLGQPKPMTSYE
jgi:hypothetical protein